MNYRSIQKRLLIITLLPCLVTALALGSYFSIDRFYQLHQQFRAQASLLSQQIALQAHILIERDDSISLGEKQDLGLKHYMTLPNLRSISLLDPSQKILQHIGPNMLPQSSNLIIDNETHRFETASSLRIKAPVFSPYDSLHTKLLGWVEIELSTDSQKLNQYTSLFINILLTLGFCFLAVILAYKASARITKPFQQVSATLKQLGSGNLNARIGLSAQTELNELATGINTMAASLQRSQQEMQENVEQATEDLKHTLDELETQNIELSMARRSAQEASKTKSEFLANMSHEIRTPLNGILGFSKLLEKTRLNKRQMDYLNTIETSSSSLLSIINDILDFSKIEAGKLVLDSVPVHLRDLTDEVLTMLAPEAHKKGIELAALVYQDVPYELIGDPVRLKQVLTNLISNAIKFTESGSVIVRIMLEEELENDAALKVTVTDTGIGLSPNQQKQLFSAFSQADSSTTRRFGGTGLGLVISQYLAAHMQGEIGVESEAGEGSVFWFTGKFNTFESYEEHWKDAAWFNKRVYIFSKWEASRQMLKNHLSQLGYSVESFKSAKDLVLTQNKKPADLILLDMDNNLEAYLIKELKEHSHVVALLTNNDCKYWQQLDDLAIKHNLVFPISFRSLTLLSQELYEYSDRRQHLMLPLPDINVLAVDDNAPNLELLTTWLQDLNVNVTQAHSGLQAVEYGITQTFDLIFMDIQMPDLDGIEATAQIREQGINKTTPLVALTAHALDNERKSLLSNGFDDYLTKPLSEDQLINTLSRWTNFKASRLQQTPMAYRNKHIVSSGDKDDEQVDIVNNILDWNVCLKISGGKAELAHKMAQGLISEAQNLLTVLNSNAESAILLEPIHKIHGLCKYVGAKDLLEQLDKAETVLKTDIGNWNNVAPNLINAIESLVAFTQDNPNWSRNV
jgi:two-component system sensor histidine kinase BarA